MSARDALVKLRELAFRAWRKGEQVEPREIVEVADEALGEDDTSTI